MVGRAHFALLAPFVAATGLVAIAIGCGGSEAPAPERPKGRPGLPTPKPPKVEAKPVEFSVQATRVGSAVHLEVTGMGRGHHEGGEFEDPETWSVRCWTAGQELARVVNGSARVERAPVGPIAQNRWDVTVIYQVGFALTGRAAEVEVEINAPGATRFRNKVALENEDDDVLDNEDNETDSR